VEGGGRKKDAVGRKLLSDYLLDMGGGGGSKEIKNR